MPDVVPQFAFWRVRIDPAAPVRDPKTGSLALSSEFFVGYHAPKDARGRTAVMIAHPEQPASRSFRYVPSGTRLRGSAGAGSAVADQVGRRPSHPIRLRPVGLASGETPGGSEGS